ncbi:MAG: cupredoxin domain-containing protein [Solirubrobacteraceae bacterium]
MSSSEQDRQTSETTPTATTRFSRPIGIVLGAVGVVLALIAVDVVLINGIQPAQARPVTQVVKVSGAPAVRPTVYLTVSPGVKPGADGKLHDAFSVTNFYVHAGQPIKLVINNTDSAAHSIVAPGAGVSIMVKPGTHTYTLLVRKAGRFQWFCGMPCDPYSMAHDGYMRGFITAS